jgi:hypothetical protein
MKLFDGPNVCCGEENSGCGLDDVRLPVFGIVLSGKFELFTVGKPIGPLPNIESAIEGPFMVGPGPRDHIPDVAEGNGRPDIISFYHDERLQRIVTGNSIGLLSSKKRKICAFRCVD